MNLEEIAWICGVSRSTVSRDTNHIPDVRPDTREREPHTLSKYHAVPSVAARSLVTQHTKRTGIRFPHDASRLFAESLSSLHCSRAIPSGNYSRPDSARGIRCG